MCKNDSSDSLFGDRGSECQNAARKKCICGPKDVCLRLEKFAYTAQTVVLGPHTGYFCPYFQIYTGLQGDRGGGMWRFLRAMPFHTDQKHQPRLRNAAKVVISVVGKILSRKGKGVPGVLPAKFHVENGVGRVVFQYAISVGGL